MPDLERITELTEPGVGPLVRLIESCREAREPIRLAVNGTKPVPVADDESIRLLIALADRLEMLTDLRLASRELDEGHGLSLDQAKARSRQK